MLAGLKVLDLSGNMELTALPAGLWSLAGLEALDLQYCGLRALPEGIGRLAGLNRLNLSYNEELTALPAGLGRLRSLEELDIDGCPGLAALHGLQEREGLPALLAHLAAQGEAAPAPGVGPEDEDATAAAGGGGGDYSDEDGQVICTTPCLFVWIITNEIDRGCKHDFTTRG